MLPVCAGLFASECDCFSFCQSLLNRLDEQPGFLCKWLRGQKAEVTKKSNLIESIVATALLASLLVVIAHLLGIPGWGATITVCAVKENSRELP
jgi:hypothetical protein